MPLSVLEELKTLNSILEEEFEYDSILEKLLYKIKETVLSDCFLIDNNGIIIKEVNFNICNNLLLKDILEKQIIFQTNSVKTPILNFTLDSSNLNKYYISFYPIVIKKEKLGNLILYRENRFEDNLNILIENIIPTIGLILNYNKMIKDLEEKQYKDIVKVAISTLSYSELDAIIYVFNELCEEEGIIVATKVADKYGLTRSIIVNAIRKLESAGIFETRSLGVKGTYIKIINSYFISEIKKLSNF